VTPGGLEHRDGLARGGRLVDPWQFVDRQRAAAGSVGHKTEFRDRPEPPADPFVQPDRFF